MRRAKFRKRFVADFGREATEAIERAAAEHEKDPLSQGMYQGTDRFQWCLVTTIGFECVSNDEYREAHRIPFSWSEFREWIYNFGNLNEYDGEADYMANISGLFSGLVRGGEEVGIIRDRKRPRNEIYQNKPATIQNLERQRIEAKMREKEWLVARQRAQVQEYQDEQYRAAMETSREQERMLMQYSKPGIVTEVNTAPLAPELKPPPQKAKPKPKTMADRFNAVIEDMSDDDV